ncbi:hypothetical protein M0657_002337 [Pyricularia oryzae]|uniref:Uncharacterized protein n=3 Tax=Pyricularia oryzae TaxID=318829 RepID=A0A4P7MVF0_PYROR|nr:hypothetical protein OOU_Y34scaffold00534g49 [Pyricularia oryzae Y34]KAI6578360.1 hypothetical protein MCOR06_010651 [Pyricularia oryzae]KAI7918990.1 hypothetical protein M9X92_006596 [Pyricularia oryzae]KAI7929079.1 hypothetical protein M0657_002337 [Pyricularia oryzae]QBZ54069.1 hypothetical protein PoMZ_09760 [Pyricularia oryzae]
MRSGLVFSSAAIASMAAPVLAGGQGTNDPKVAGCLARQVVTDIHGKQHRGGWKRIWNKSTQFEHEGTTVTVTVDGECNLEAVAPEISNVGYDVAALRLP